jgi:hypothetical protein
MLERARRNSYKILERFDCLPSIHFAQYETMRILISIAKRYRPSSVLLYGCELLGYGNCDIIERVHLKLCKMLLHMKSSTPSFMVYGELGRYLLAIDIKIRMVS